MIIEKSPQQQAEEKIEEQYGNLKTPLTPPERQAIKAYKEVVNYLGIDTINDPQNPVLAPDKVVTDALYLTLTEDQLMYYVGVLSGIRPYLGEELIDAKAKSIYASTWKKFNEMGFRVNYRRDALEKEVQKLEKRLNIDSKLANKAIKKHYTEDNLKDESVWRNYIWAKLEADKIRKAELLQYYAHSIDNLIVALKERVRYMNPEKSQAKFGDQANTLMRI